MSSRWENTKIFQGFYPPEAPLTYHHETLSRGYRNSRPQPAFYNIRKLNLCSKTNISKNHGKQSHIETLYPLSVLKELMQIDCKKACSVMEQAWISTFCWHICQKYLNHFIALVFFYTSWNIPENQSFPDVFRWHWKRPVPWNGLRVI